MDNTTYSQIFGDQSVDVLADEAKHPFAVAELRRSLRGQLAQVLPLDASGTARQRPAVVLVDADDVSDGLPLSVSRADVGSVPPGGYLVRRTARDGQPVVVLAGGDTAGVIYAVQELTEQLRRPTTGGVSSSPLDVRREPALAHRLFWTWDHSTNWYLEGAGQQESGAANYYSKPGGSFLEDYRRLIDFMVQVRLNGVVIYGFLRDRHGGVEAAREIARYGRERGVRVIPGVGINSYGGIYWEGNHRYNLGRWLTEHPELRAQSERELPFPVNHYGVLACPSKPANLAYHAEAIHWLCEEFEIGGINFESGDYGICQCPDCQARRRDQGAWSLSDAAELFPPLVEAAKSARSDLWLIAEAYFDNLLDLDVVGQLAGLPPEMIGQYCINRRYWPRVRAELTAEHVRQLPFSANVVRTHMGSQWNGERYRLIARDFADLASLAARTGMRGMDVFGEVSAFNVANEINFLAYATFGYDREATWETFVANVLAPRLGGVSQANEYLALLDANPTESQLQEANGRAREISAPLNDEEQRRRWSWLTNELYRRAYGLI